MRRALLVLSLAGAVLAVSGCGAASDAPSGSPAPTASVLDLGAAQPHQLYTHCGVIWTQFQGATWYADPPLSDGNGNPPPGFGNPTDSGTMRRVSAHRAQYVSSSGRTVTFVDSLPAGASDPPLCS